MPLSAVDVAALYRTPAVGAPTKTVEERLRAALEDESSQQLALLAEKVRKTDIAISALTECGGDASANAVKDMQKQLEKEAEAAEAAASEVEDVAGEADAGDDAEAADDTADAEGGDE